MKCETGSCDKKHGALKHWLAVRVSAVIAIPLTIWLVYSIVSLAGADYQTFRAWVATPLNAFEMALFIVIVFFHTALGSHEIVEDYVHHERAKKSGICLINAFFLMAGALCLFCIFKIAFGGV